MGFIKDIKNSTKQSVFFLALCTLAFSCQEKEPTILSDKYELLISSNLYDEEFLGSLIILEADVSNQMLYIQVGYSGCGESKDFTLVFSEQVFDTSPPTLDAKLIFDPITLCEAFFTSEIEIDLSSLNQLTSRPYRIRLNGWSGVIEIK